MDAKKIKEIIKPNKKKKKICLITLLIAIISIFIGTYIDRDRNVIPKDYHELIYKEIDKEKEYVKVNITSIFAFAKKDNLIYYFITDENNYLYIARITDNTYKRIEELYKEDNNNFKYELKGYIFKIPNDIIEIAINSYNKEYNEEILTEDNINDYVGECYIDEIVTPYTSISATFIGIGIAFFITSIVIFIIIIINSINSLIRKRKYNMDDVYSELSKPNTLEYPNIYLTDKYLISNLNSFMVFTYDDFIWLYNEKRKINGIYIGTYLKGITKNKKIYYLGYTRNKEEFFEDVMYKSYQKNNNILIGYTSENQKKYRSIKNNK